MLASTREGKHSLPRSFDWYVFIRHLIDIDTRERIWYHCVSCNSGNYRHFSSFRYYMEQSDVDKLDGMRDGIFAEVTTHIFLRAFTL